MKDFGAEILFDGETLRLSDDCAEYVTDGELVHVEGIETDGVDVLDNRAVGDGFDAVKVWGRDGESVADNVCVAVGVFALRELDFFADSDTLHVVVGDDERLHVSDLVGEGEALTTDETDPFEDDGVKLAVRERDIIFVRDRGFE